MTNVDGEPLLRIDGVAKSFGRLEVLRNINLTVREGEILGIIGPNGAGKSTLFNIVAGVLSPSTGTLIYGGRDLRPMAMPARAKAGIGRTYQIPMPFRKMSVFENLLVAAVHGQGLGIAAARDECYDVLVSTGLMRRQAEPAAALGLLDLKRLELARALCLKPRLLLLDEVAGGLTDGECVELVELVRSTNARGVTVVWVEHVLNALAGVVTRLAMLSEGSILLDGSFDEVMAAPVVRAAYLGS